jgi:hypothetical protein
MKLTIKTLKGEKFQLEVDDTKTVEELKGLIVSIYLFIYTNYFFSLLNCFCSAIAGSGKVRATCLGYETHSQRKSTQGY